MNIIYYDCFSGISGDMNLAAMIDLGIDPNFLRDALSKLNLTDEFELKVIQDSKYGVMGTRVDVVLKKETDSPHRNLKNIEDIIEKSTLDENIQHTAKKIFKKLAKAESAVHGKEINEIHFHEVGGVDAIVDIVGAAICYHTLCVDEIWCSAIELGGGFVKCAHGLLPVPAPATAEILKGIPVKYGGVNKEATTPTGAAIIATLTDRFLLNPECTVEKTAYGIGHMDFQIPNMLRVQKASSILPVNTLKTEPAKLLQCNIDDMTAEMLGVVMDILFAEGAGDVHFTAIIMKKNRPATSLSVLCSASDEDKFKDLIFKHTTTLGIKSISIEKSKLERSYETLKTPLGTVTMKNAMKNGTIIRSKPEFEDVKKLAKQHRLSLNDVYTIIGKLRK